MIDALATFMAGTMVGGLAGPAGVALHELRRMIPAAEEDLPGIVPQLLKIRSYARMQIAILFGWIAYYTAQIMAIIWED